VDEFKNKNNMAEQGVLRLTGVFFSYDSKKQNILNDINLNVSPGQTLGVVGVIGAGKTTLAHILMRFYDPVSGDIFIGGKSIREIPLRSLRDYIGYVSQEPFLFSTSVKNNIALGRENVSDSEIQEIIKVSGLESDLNRFPDHIETLVGEKGVALSGGQKQRIALARALLKNPKILILDDSFSNLDSAMEVILLKNLKKYFRDTTKIIISHRLSAIMNADQIVVVNDGAVLERGTHLQLIKHGGMYAELFRNQELMREMEIFLR